MTEKQEEPLCPGCKEVKASHRQIARPHLCAWCDYNHDTGEVTGFRPASDPFANLEWPENE